jgi:pilus assembly protein CpaC
MRLNRTEQITESPRRHRVLGTLLALICLTAIATGSSAAEHTQTRIVLASPNSIEDVSQAMRLEQGKSTFLQTEYSISRVSVGDAEIVDVKVLGPREIQLLAKKIGNTNVVIWSPKNSPKAAISVTVDTPHTHVQTQLRDLLNSDDIVVEGAGGSLILRGSVPNALAVESAMTVAHAYSEDVINLLEVGGEHQVMLEVTIAEMSRKVGRRLGSNWSAMSDGGTTQILSFLSNLSTLDSMVTTAQAFILSDNVNLVASFATGGWIFDVFLDLLEEKGLGKVLAEPTLVARSGEGASFLAGGEVPIIVPQGTANNAINVEYKTFGIAMNFEPIVLDDERISIDVSTEASEIDPTLGVFTRGFNVPGFRTRRAATTIELADGHSFAIAGMLKEDVRQVVNQYPWLGELPIIGTAFRSSEFQREESELVILVTPRLAKPIAPGHEMVLPTDHYIEPSAWEFYMFGYLEGRFWDRSDIENGDQGAQTAMNSSATPEAGGLMGGSGLRVRGEVIEQDAPANLASLEADSNEANKNNSDTDKETTPWDF